MSKLGPRQRTILALLTRRPMCNTLLSHHLGGLNVNAMLFKLNARGLAHHPTTHGPWEITADGLRAMRPYREAERARRIADINEAMGHPDRNPNARSRRSEAPR